jgi:Spy/CpxP family protein refolding chaperone
MDRANELPTTDHLKEVNMQRGWRGAALALGATLVLAGSAMAQRGGGFGFGGRGGGSGANMLSMPEVQTELKLTDEQKTKVMTLVDQLRDERQQQFQELRDLSADERQKRMAEIRTDTNKRVNAILNTDQQKRYHQLELQRMGMSALAQKDVADELKLTDDQRTKIQGILDEQMTSMRSAFPRGGGGAGGGRPDFNAMRQQMEAMRKKTDEKIAAVLTDDQKKQWKEMQGAPFTFPQNGPGGPRRATT